MILVSNLSVIYDNDPFSRSSDKIQTQNLFNDNTQNLDVSGLLSNAPRAFTINHGQLENDDVLFYDQSGAVWFTAEGVFFELREYVEPRGQGGVRVTPQTHTLQKLHNSPNIQTHPHQYKSVILKQEFVGANEVQPLGRERLGWKSNFFYGNFSEDWCIDVPNYAEVWYENIYDGIDLRYYTNGKGLKYDLLVHPGGKVDDIGLKYEGAEITNDDYNLYLKTPVGTVTDGGLFIYQKIEDRKIPVIGKYIVKNDFIRFQIDHDYDPNYTLVIDPPM
jgi:hypothetical protein